jgi:hypothetical protein
LQAAEELQAIIETEAIAPIAMSNAKLVIHGGSNLIGWNQQSDEDGPIPFEVPIGSVPASGTLFQEVWFRAIAPDSGVVQAWLHCDQLLPQAAEAGLAISPCGGDFNGTGQISVEDLFNSLDAYFTQSGLPQPQPGYSADVNGDGFVTVQDVFDFMALYYVPC